MRACGASLALPAVGAYLDGAGLAGTEDDARVAVLLLDPVFPLDEY